MKKGTKAEKLPFMINLVLGDDSGDGHGRTETVTIRSNIDKEEVSKAYKAGVNVTGIDVENDVANDYEDSLLPQATFDALTKHGLVAKAVGLTNSDKRVAGYALWHDTFAMLWLFIVRVGNPGFRFKVMKSESPNITIGGYGLFQ